jgi:pyruvate dehydrogenase E1 component alpha subunit
MLTVEELIAFEADIAAEFNAGKIRAPIHLDGGNEKQLIKIFQEYRPGDWVCCSWRSHYKALLCGIPPVKVKAEIMAGRSICLCFPEYRFLSSAIVGGNLPIALGIAWSIKRSGGKEKVFAFLGDMTAHGGMYHECLKYATNWDLPIKFFVENNMKSVCTDTGQVWGEYESPHYTDKFEEYFYTLPFPHSGAGVRVNF